jgi:hypothetical protein
VGESIDGPNRSRVSSVLVRTTPTSSSAYLPDEEP